MDENNDDNVETQEKILQQIAIMESEHSDLDAVIERLGEDLPFDQLKLQRLKKRKLVLKMKWPNCEAAIYQISLRDKNKFCNLDWKY